MAPFDRSNRNFKVAYYTTLKFLLDLSNGAIFNFLLGPIVNIALSCTVFKLFDVTLNNIVTFKFGLEVTQGHSNWYHSKTLCAVSYSPSIVTMAVSLTVYNIFIVKA